MPSLYGNAAENSLRDFGLGFGKLNRLNEYGLIISDYNSYFQYQIIEDNEKISMAELHHQDVCWDWTIEQENVTRKIIELHGVAMTVAGTELSKVVSQEVTKEYTDALRKYLLHKFRINMRRSEDIDTVLSSSQTRAYNIVNDTGPRGSY